MKAQVVKYNHNNTALQSIPQSIHKLLPLPTSIPGVVDSVHTKQVSVLHITHSYHH